MKKILLVLCTAVAFSFSFSAVAHKSDNSNAVNYERAKSGRDESKWKIWDTKNPKQTKGKVEVTVGNVKNDKNAGLTILQNHMGNH